MWRKRAEETDNLRTPDRGMGAGRTIQYKDCYKVTSPLGGHIRITCYGSEFRFPVPRGPVTAGGEAEDLLGVSRQEKD